MQDEESRKKFFVQDYSSGKGKQLKFMQQDRNFEITEVMNEQCKNIERGYIHSVINHLSENPDLLEGSSVTIDDIA